jgi:hypothetical protein
MGYALSHSRRQRIHLESSMFSSALVDFTVVITDSMVSELAEAGGLLDSAGPALSDGHDIRIAADANGDVALPIDLRGYAQDADPANGSIEFATKLSLTDPIAGNDIYIFFGDDDAATLLPTDPLGQYNAYDDNYFLISPCGCGLDRSSNQWATTNNGGLTPGDAVTPWGLGTIFDGNASQQYLSFNDVASWNALLEVDQPNSVEVLARNDNATSGLPQFIAAKIAETTSYQGWNFLYHSGLSELTVNNNYGTGSAIGRAATFTMVQGTWYHLATTYSGNNNASGFLIYANGANLTTSDKTTGTGSTNQHSYPFLVGARGWGKPNSQREWDGILDELRMSSVVRSADWIAATHANFMQSSTTIIGYASEIALGAIIPYSGNEADYEAFNSVGGGYFQGDGNAFFRLGQEKVIDVTQPFEIEFKAFYNASYVEGFNGLFSPKAGSPGRIIVQNSNRRIYPHGANLPSAVYLGSLIDDANWHTYKIVGDGVDVSFVRDGSTERSVGIASYDGGFKYDSLLVNTNEEHPWEHNVAYLSVTKNGVLTHYWDFGLTNAAGDAGPDRVWDLVGGIHGVGDNTGNSNWGRTANLPNNLRNGFNLYSLEPNFPVPASLNVPGFDPFGVAIQYSNPIPSGGVVDYDTLVSISKALLGTKPYDTAIAISKALAFLRDYDAHVDISKAIQGTKPYDTKVEIFSAGVSVKQYDTSITINKLLAFMLSYDTRVTISKAYYNQKDYDTIVTITKVIDQVRGYDTEVSISKTLQSNKDYDTIVRAIRDSKVPLEVIHKANLRMADRILYRNLRIASKDEYKRLRIH